MLGRKVDSVVSKNGIVLIDDVLATIFGGGVMFDILGSSMESFGLTDSYYIFDSGGTFIEGDAGSANISRGF